MLLGWIVLAGLGSTGCLLRAVRDGVDGLEQSSTISGELKVPADWERTTVVLLRSDVGRLTPVSTWTSFRPGRFHFFTGPGSYVVVAFQAGADGTVPRDPGKWAVQREPRPATLRRGGQVSGVALEARSPKEAIGHEELFEAVTGSVLLGLPRVRRSGEVLPIEDLRFGPKAGKLGLWQPGLFEERHGWGIFFLRPYEPGRIPVIFIHGAGGYPQEWARVMAGLDPKRYQPWVFQYPSGTRLAPVVDGVTDMLDELKSRLGFTELVVVAHSMGGLVARSALSQGPGHPWVKDVSHLVTIATPWLGMEAAQRGVSQSPYVIPSWIDLAPGSDFVRSIHRTPMPSRTAYALFFGYQRGLALLSRESSDRTVTLRSMLDAEAQAEATTIRGFDEDHDSILASAEVVAELRRLLATEARAR